MPKLTTELSPEFLEFARISENIFIDAFRSDHEGMDGRMFVFGDTGDESRNLMWVVPVKENSKRMQFAMLATVLQRRKAIRYSVSMLAWISAQTDTPPSHAVDRQECVFTAVMHANGEQSTAILEVTRGESGRPESFKRIADFGEEGEMFSIAGNLLDKERGLPDETSDMCEVAMARYLIHGDVDPHIRIEDVMVRLAEGFRVPDNVVKH